MKKGIMRVLMIAMVLSIGGILSGCGKDDVKHLENKGPQSVSLVLGVHNYFPAISFQTDSVYDRIYEACYTYGDCSGVTVDGDPFVACNYNINEPDKKIDRAKRKQLASNSTSQIISELSKVSAQTPEIDTLSAIHLSADTLQSTEGSSDKSMVVFDSGLSTTSLLNFSTQNIIDEPVDSIVSQLEELHAIPNLQDIHIVWVGLGQTCGEQDRLTKSYRYKLQNIWEGILKAGNAASVTFDTSPLSTEEYSMDLPKCSTVPIIADSLEVADTVTEKEMPEVIKWDGNSSLQFIKNEAQFIDKQAALKEMKPIAEYLVANPNEKVSIFGMIASVPDKNSGKVLSEERAAACKNILLEQGVEEHQVTTVGLGQVSNPLRVKDVDTLGRQIEEQAQKNRAVFVVKSDSELVGALMKCI